MTSDEYMKLSDKLAKAAEDARLRGDRVHQAFFAIKAAEIAILGSYVLRTEMAFESH